MMVDSLSRRSFVKGVGTASLVGALGLSLGALSSCAVEKKEESAADSGSAVSKETRWGYCQNCIALSCSYKATVENGIVTALEGSPERTMNKGTLCARANGLIMYQYNPYRIKAPMKRTNPEKGMDVDPGWVEITWDEALDEAARVLKDVYDKNPLELVFTWGFAEMDVVNNGAAGPDVLGLVLGTKTSSMSKGQFCSMHYASGLTMYDLYDHQMDYFYGKYAVVLGKGFGMNAGFADGSARGAAHFFRNGGKAVFVDPLRTNEGSLGEWVPIKPATDLSFVYGLLYTMLYELGDYDIESVKARTNGPYLIGADGEYVRGTSGKPQMWDQASGSAKDFDDASIADVALEGTFTVDGAEATTAFSLFKARFADFTPEWAEGICTIPAATIRGLAKDLIDNARIGETIEVDGQVMPYRPSVLIGGRAICNHEDGVLIDLGVRFVNNLLGNVFVPGGANETGGKAPADDDGVIKPYFEAKPCTGVVWPPEQFDLHDVLPHRHSTDSLLWQVISEGPEKWNFEIKPRVLLSAAANSVTCTCNPDTVIEALGKFEYVIYSSCYHVDETAMMADLLLPCDSKLEGVGIAKKIQAPFNTAEESFMKDANQYMVRDVIPPLYNTMNGNEMAMELLDRMGLLAGFNEKCNERRSWGTSLKDTEYALDVNERYTMEDIYDRYLRNTCGDDKGLDYIKEHGVIDIPNPLESSYRYFYDPKTRIPLYVMSQKHSGELLLSRMEEIGLDESYLGYSLDYLRERYDPLPTYPGPENRKLFNAPEEFDLTSFFFRKPLFLYRFGGQDQNPWSRDWSERFDPEFGAVLVNAATAKAKGLADGDEIIVESYHGGKVKARLLTTERIHPEAIGFTGAIGRRTKNLGENLANDPLYAEMLNGHTGYLEPIHGGTENSTRAKIYKA